MSQIARFTKNRAWKNQKKLEHIYLLQLWLNKCMDFLNSYLENGLIQVYYN